MAIKTHGTMLALQERRKTESTNLQLQAMIKPHVDAGGQQSIKNVPLWVAEAIMNFHPTALSHRVSLEMQKCSDEQLRAIVLGHPRALQMVSQLLERASDEELKALMPHIEGRMLSPCPEKQVAVPGDAELERKNAEQEQKIAERDRKIEELMRKNEKLEQKIAKLQAQVDAKDDFLNALTNDMAGMDMKKSPEEDPEEARQRQALEKEVAEGCNLSKTFEATKVEMPENNADGYRNSQLVKVRGASKDPWRGGIITKTTSHQVTVATLLGDDLDFTVKKTNAKKLNIESMTATEALLYKNNLKEIRRRLALHESKKALDEAKAKKSAGGKKGILAEFL